jgi:hypothetical protein
MSSVRKALIWHAKDYGTLREKLRSAVPNPTVTFSDAGFVTVDVLSDSGKSQSSSSKGRCFSIQ